MTVTYTGEVATCRGFGCFLKLLLRWRGSIYKLVWPDLMVFLLLYYVLNFTYRFWLNEDQRKIFENITQYCETFNDLIPLSFVLGFYVSIVMQRWWNQYVSIPWPDPIAVFVSSNIHGQDERGRVMRRTIMRYVCLCLTMVFSMISPRVKKRFPTLQNFVEAGLLNENEKAIMSDLNEKFPRHSKHWLPIVWAASIVTRARKEGRIRDDFAVKTIIDELNKFRGQCGLLLSYDSISIPLVYTQVVTLAVYSYFITCVMGRQWLDIPDQSHPLHKHMNNVDLYFPVFTTLQFFFYMGWLKVAESLINPFGEDDDDFEVNWLVDRNLQVSYLIVDEMHHEHPELIRDQYWDEVFPAQLPYTIASEPFREQHPQPSTANIEVPKSMAEPLLAKPEDGGDHNFDDTHSGIHFIAGGKRSLSRVSTRERMTSAGSASSINTNVGSLASSIHRVGSVTSVLRRLFSRDGSGTGSAVTTTTVPANIPDGSAGNSAGSRMPKSNSAASLKPPFAGGGSMRIADQVIEEVDEQSTVTSMRPPDLRPNVRTIFASGVPHFPGPPPPSAPVAVPHSVQASGPHLNITPLSSSAPASAVVMPAAAVSPAPSSTTYTEIMSVKSAPGYGDSSKIGPGGRVDRFTSQPASQGDSTSFFGGRTSQADGDDVSIGGSSTNSSEDDEFTRLKQTRQKERKEKLIQRLARSVSAQHPGSLDNETLLLEITGDSRTGLLSSSQRSSVLGDSNV
ncbi:bestrophin-2-like isoform X2 [Schistocerca cancellata]|uniref:bestrophin-2-like isoform X2 n=1 Tax=Schistocerca cancellata TaxID=274614 RepID=UPI002119AE3F|nr:bestrophin-2-like isoform X2 [Schistocerca cancellata]